MSKVKSFPIDKYFIATPRGLKDKHEPIQNEVSPKSIKHESFELKPKDETQKIQSQWMIIQRENLRLRYCRMFDATKARELLRRCEDEIVYNTGILAQVKMFGKLIDIPRKQVAHGDAGLTYSFSGNTVPALPWTPLLSEIKDHICECTGHSFNFVLINRYKDGSDYMGEHKDDEKELSPGSPIASLSLGQPRDFVFKHQDYRGANRKRKLEASGDQAGMKSFKINKMFDNEVNKETPGPSVPGYQVNSTSGTVSFLLEHGSLLLMEAPTNSFWYHSLPRRSRAVGVRINMTFRQMDIKHCKPAQVLDKT